MKNIFKKFNKQKKFSRGFTLIETLVAIFILVIAVVAPMSIASKALSTARYAKEQVTAYYLSQEGIELVRAIRDSNILDGTTWNEGPIGNSSGGTVCYKSDGCSINPLTLGVTACNPSGSSCGLLYLNSSSGFYTDDSSSGSYSGYSRVVRVSKVNNNGNQDDEILITSTVTWQSSTLGSSKSIVITSHLLKW